MCYACRSKQIARRLETPLGTLEACAIHALNLCGFWIRPQMKITPASHHHARQYDGGPKRNSPGNLGNVFRKGAGQ
jgi:hypothetical protein